VACASRERRASKPNDPVFLVALEIGIEIQSPSDAEAELRKRKRLFFETSAAEFWLCDLMGSVTFFNPAGEIPRSRLCPDFPQRITCD